jgi:hypothetical protein
MESSVHSRAIIHLDLDCFYAQVEQVRLSISNEPLCVQQWNGILAGIHDLKQSTIWLEIWESIDHGHPKKSRKNIPMFI